jgi:predicted GTPase
MWQVLAVTAVRTGCGKSQVAGYSIGIFNKHNIKTVLVRHPMPYGDLHIPLVLFHNMA